MFKNICVAVIALSNIVFCNQVEKLLTCGKLQNVYRAYGFTENLEYQSQCLVYEKDSSYYTHYILNTGIKNVFWIESFIFNYSSNRDSFIVRKKITLKKNNMYDIKTYLYSGIGDQIESNSKINQDIIPGTNMSLFVDMYKFILMYPKFSNINDTIKIEFKNTLDSLNSIKKDQGNLSIDP